MLLTLRSVLRAGNMWKVVSEGCLCVRRWRVIHPTQRKKSAEVVRESDQDSGSFRGIKMGGDPIAQWRDYFHRLAWEHLVAPPEELDLGGDRRCEHLCLDGSSCDLGQISRWRNNE